MILIAIVAVILALVQGRASHCREKASSHALLEGFHAAEAARASALWTEHRMQAQQRAAQFEGYDESELHVAFDAEAKGHRIEALFQRYTMGYNNQMALWHASEKKKYEHAAVRPWVYLPQDPGQPPISRPRRE